jgi:hypothetical protein
MSPHGQVVYTQASPAPFGEGRAVQRPSQAITPTPPQASAQTVP